MKRLVFIAALAVMAVLVSAVIALAQDITEQSAPDTSSSDTTQSADPSEEATPAQSAATVSITSGAFEPAQLNVAPGTTVTFVNEDTVPHTVVLDSLFSTPELLPGYTYPVSFEGTGTVTYHDESNPEMQGSIVFGPTVPEEVTTAPEDVASVPPSTTEGTTQTGESTAPVDSVS